MDVDSSIRTRSRAKQQAEQWQMVPLPAKLLSLLTDTVSESQALKADGTQPGLPSLQHGMSNCNASMCGHCSCDAGYTAVMQWLLGHEIEPVDKQQIRMMTTNA